MLRLAARSAKYFAGSTRHYAASAMRMPAMSPTMTEGGIVEWKFSAGDSFNAGDVLLDIETDKAQISVEAQDDGILGKIIAQNGEEGIPVGRPIAVLAEPEDDLSAIDFDAIISAASKGSSEPASESSSASKPAESQKPAAAPAAAPKPAGSSGHAEVVPGSVLPSALRLLHENGYSENDLASIQGSGPKNRVLKGDVLAFLGQIPKDAPTNLKAAIGKLEHLDLSNIELAAPPAPKVKAEKPKPVVWERSLELTGHLVNVPAAAKQIVESASREAVRDTLIAFRPRPSRLRDPVLDLLTKPKNNLGFTLSHSVKVVRGKAHAVDIRISFGTATPSEEVLDRAEVYLFNLVELLQPEEEYTEDSAAESSL